MFIFKEEYYKCFTQSRLTVLYFFFFLYIPVLVCGQTQTDTLTYKVITGDTLTEISQQFGNVNFWNDLFEGNKDKISNPDFIYPGQVLDIPLTVVQSAEYKTIFQKSADTLQRAKEQPTDSSFMLKKFRTAFEKVASQEEKAAPKENMNKEKTIINGLDLGDLIINKTKSRMGSEFFYAFNDSWSDSGEPGNYIIEINEQPSPSMGALIIVNINHNEVFKTNVHPRLSMEEIVNYTMYMCNRYITENSSTLTNIY